VAAITAQVSTASTTDGPTFVSGSFTPPAGGLLVAFVASTGTLAAGALTASANGITFTRVATALKNTSVDAIYLFVANQLVPASPASMTVTFDCTGDDATGAVVMVASASAFSRAGAVAVRQTVVVSNEAGGLTPAPVFAAAARTENPTLVGNFTASGAGSTPPAGWTEQVDTSYATPTTGGGYVSRDSGFTGTTITWGSTITGQHGLIAVELDTSPVDYIRRRGPNYRR